MAYTAPAGGAPEVRLASLWDQGHQDASALGVPVAGPAASELTAALEELNAPGPFLALSHGTRNPTTSWCMSTVLPMPA